MSVRLGLKTRGRGRVEHPIGGGGDGGLKQGLGGQYDSQLNCLKGQK